jgi:predicted extracellular nuclease
MKLNDLFLLMIKKLLTTGFFCLIFLSACITQTGKKRNTFIVMSYNTENFFDTINDPHTFDNDFTPDSKKHWNAKRYKQKVEGIARVISEVTPGRFPDIILLCEVENQAVMIDLANQKVILAAGYRVVFRKSHDKRGISIGLLYRKKTFRLLVQNLICIEYPGEKRENTRGILYVKGIVLKDDTVHIFGNHWKSRVGKLEETDSKRIYDAGILRCKTDSLFRLNKQANIICLGDFNDEPGNSSISKILNAGCNSEDKTGEILIDVMCPLYLEGNGTYSYKGKWQMLDNIILSKNLLSNKSRLHMAGKSGEVFKPDWLLKYNNKAGGSIPWKTYAGDKYLGGYSDHLPVFVELVKNEK